MSTIRQQALACRDAAQVVAALGSETKRTLLRDMATALEAQSADVLAANAEDMRQATAKGVQGAMLDRLRLDEARVTGPGVCNALETLQVHRDVAAAFLPRAVQALRERGVEWRGDERSRARVPGMHAAIDDDYAAEFLDLILAVRVIDGLDEAIDHIRRYGSDRTEVIATADQAAARRFVQAIRSAVVMVNASSRFSDGGEPGLSAEIGISTTRLHAYGPMGAESLTIERFMVRGERQVRHPQSQV